jgi:hypothetical protein
MDLMAVLPDNLCIPGPNAGTLADVMVQNGMDFPLALREGNITLAQAAESDLGFLYDVAQQNVGLVEFSTACGYKFGAARTVVLLQRERLGMWRATSTLTEMTPTQTPSPFHTIPGSHHVLIGAPETSKMPTTSDFKVWFQNRGSVDSVAAQDVLYGVGFQIHQWPVVGTALVQQAPANLAYVYKAVLTRYMEGNGMITSGWNNPTLSISPVHGLRYPHTNPVWFFRAIVANLGQTYPGAVRDVLQCLNFLHRKHGMADAISAQVHHTGKRFARPPAYMQALGSVTEGTEEVVLLRQEPSHVPVTSISVLPLLGEHLMVYHPSGQQQLYIRTGAAIKNVSANIDLMLVRPLPTSLVSHEELVNFIRTQPMTEDGRKIDTERSRAIINRFPTSWHLVDAMDVSPFPAGVVPESVVAALQYATPVFNHNLVVRRDKLLTLEVDRPVTMRTRPVKTMDAEWPIQELSCTGTGEKYTVMRSSSSTTSQLVHVHLTPLALRISTHGAPPHTINRPLPEWIALCPDQQSTVTALFSSDGSTHLTDAMLRGI